MLTRLIVLYCLLALLPGCKNNTGNPTSKSATKFDSDEKKISNNTYCAAVEYYNPNTETRSSYTLTVDVNNNKIVEIHWPNGGRIDQENFKPSELDQDGHTEFTNEKGYKYDVQIIGKGEDCFKNVPLAVQCRGFTKSGQRCKHMTDNPNGLCWQHQN